VANRYGRAGGNWSASGTWSASSGGGSDGAGINAGDAVILDANSSGTFTIDTTISIVTLDCTGFTGTLTHNSVVLTVSGGTFKLVAGMVYTPTTAGRQVAFTSTGTVLITSAGKTFGAITFNGTGGVFQIQDDMAVRSDGTITLTAGQFDANNFNVTMGGFVSSGAGVTRRITPGSGTWTVNSTGVTPSTVWDLTSAAGNLTLDAGTWTLVVTASATTGRSLNFGVSKTYNNITFVTTGTASNGTTVILSGSTAVTFNVMTLTPPVLVAVGGGTITYNITSLVSSGTAASNTNTFFAREGSVITMAVTGATIEYSSISGITFTGSPTATNSFDGGRNTGITISGPSGGGVVGVIGG
jgi:hypothetical protein